GDARFEPAGAGDERHSVGRLSLPMTARLVINDGQHRRAGIEAALRERPELGDETIAVVLFLDVGLSRSQQMFADLNRYAVRSATSLNILYDHRDEDAQAIKAVIQRVPVFRDLTDLQRATLSPRSTKLFTLSAIYHATNVLLADQRELSAQARIEL